MSIFVNKFNTIFVSIMLMLIGIDIGVIYYGLIPIQLLISLNLAALGFLVLLRGVKEHDIGERKFYFLWSSVLFIIALSISTGSFAGLAIGLAVLFLGLGAVFLYISTRAFL